MAGNGRWTLRLAFDGSDLAAGGVTGPLGRQQCRSVGNPPLGSRPAPRATGKPELLRTPGIQLS